MKVMRVCPVTKKVWNGRRSRISRRSFRSKIRLSWTMKRKAMWKVCPLRPRRSQWRPPCWEFQGHQRRRQQGHRGGVVFIDHIYRSKPLWMMRHFRCPSKRLDPTDPTETADPTDRPQIARAKIESLSLPMRRQLTSSHQKRIKVQSVHPGQPQLPRKPNCQALEWRKWRKISMIHPHPDLPHSEGLR